MDNFVNHSYNFALLFSTFGLLSELKSRKNDLSRCLVVNGNIALTLTLVGTSAKIYRDIVS